MICLHFFVPLFSSCLPPTDKESAGCWHDTVSKVGSAIYTIYFLNTWDWTIGPICYCTFGMRILTILHKHVYLWKNTWKGLTFPSWNIVQTTLHQSLRNSVSYCQLFDGQFALCNRSVGRRRRPRKKDDVLYTLLWVQNKQKNLSIKNLNRSMIIQYSNTCYICVTMYARMKCYGAHGSDHIFLRFPA
jgi:hypothetical protein